MAQFINISLKLRLFFLFYQFTGDRTVARWMQPPHKSYRSSTRYKGFIEARVPAKENSIQKDNPNSHFYSARVRYALELASKFHESSLVYSVDNKNKILLGDQVAAVDRHLKIHRFFPSGDCPNLPDHDFPTPGYFIVPCGYLQMLPPALPSTLTKDDLGRDQYEYNIIITRVKTTRWYCKVTVLISSYMRIVHFLLIIFKGTSPVITTKYSSSALNPVERLWAPCTRALTSTSIPAALPGELPPKRQSLSQDERERKDAEVFNNAMERVKHYWKGLHYAGHPVTTITTPSGTQDAPFNDFDRVHTAVSSSATRLREDRAVNDEYKFVMRHMDRRIGMVIFAKCADPGCQHCSSNPPVAGDMLQCVRDFPTPVPSLDHPGHFFTFIEALRRGRDPPCEHMPLFQQKSLGRCKETGCKYVFTRKKDIDDHRRKLHR
ncbi:uncharacterized protein LOC119725453 [Patiria miniata]|uniref:C2H2-type domain-containing protein n=1 Tax=Patiria miniata TaxID=46514 RepID=A0A913ZLW1_PATMI|nr:uncharacterized protein LOC119725453 [Patiria miniata]